MTEVPARAVDLAVTSPPYFCVKDYAGFGGRAVAHRDDCGAIRDYRDYVSALLDVWNECCRVLKPNGKLIVNAPLMPLPKRETSTHHNRDIFNIYSDIEHSILRRIPGMHLEERLHLESRQSDEAADVRQLSVPAEPVRSEHRGVYWRFCQSGQAGAG